MACRFSITVWRVGKDGCIYSLHQSLTIVLKMWAWWIQRSISVSLLRHSLSALQSFTCQLLLSPSFIQSSENHLGVSSVIIMDLSKASERTEEYPDDVRSLSSPSVLVRLQKWQKGTLINHVRGLSPPSELTKGALLGVMGGHPGHVVHPDALGFLGGQCVLQLHQQHSGGAIHQVQHTLVDAHRQLGERSLW